MREKALVALQLHFDSVEMADDPNLNAAASSSLFDSDLSVSILKEYLLGDKSAAEVQRLAYLAYKDQLQVLRKDAVAQGRNIQDQTSKTLKALASMGNWGKRPGNVNTEIMSFLGEPKMPPPLKIEVTLKVPKPKARRAFRSAVRVMYPLIPPHMFLRFSSYTIDQLSIT